MRNATIARNYAEVLLTLAQRADNDLAGWGRMIGDLADATRTDASFRRFLESPRVSAEDKIAVLARALGSVDAPRTFVRFVGSLVTHRRQLLIPEIAAEYQNLVDEAEGRLHADVTVARPATPEDERVITEQLTRALGKRVVPHVRVNPAILGGVVVRVGDTVMDGSVRRRLTTLRNRLVTGR
jgi:F-type H+-transporting ATPase subunit delta